MNLQGSGGYNPGEHARAVAKPPAPTPPPEDTIADKCGRKSTGQTFAQCVKLPCGFIGIPYSFFAGSPSMDLEATCIEIPFQGHVKIDGKWIDGHEGEHLLIIRGKRLTSVFDHICWAMRAYTHPGGAAEPVSQQDTSDAYVERTEIKKMEDVF